MYITPVGGETLLMHLGHLVIKTKQTFFFFPFCGATTQKDPLPSPKVHFSVVFLGFH